MDEELEKEARIPKNETNKKLFRRFISKKKNRSSVPPRKFWGNRLAVENF